MWGIGPNVVLNWLKSCEHTIRIKNLNKRFRVSSAIKYRPEIDGLRALAVLSVLGFHIFGIRGGFVGVDIFFVISGYLISQILISELNSEKFSFSSFYCRRIRRIFPALITILIFCLVTGWITLLADEFKFLGKHIFFGTTFSSNIVLWLESGYFDRASDLKPLLHLWSLGVEEQFYIFWPLFLVIAFWRRWPIFIFLATLISISFFCNLYLSSVNASFAFYWLPTRMWELLCGALLAHIAITQTADVGMGKFAKCLYVRQLLPILGVGLILISLIYIESRRAYPSYWALIPVLGTIFILLGDKDSLVNKYFLSSKLMRGIGLISYPLYLWHWPLISYAKIMNNGTLDRELKLICFILSFLFAYLTYQFVEKKIRYASNSRAIGYLLLGMLVVSLMGLSVFFLDGISARYPYQEKIYSQSKEVDGSISHFDWEQGCKQHFKALDYSGACRIADSTKPPTILIVGDSHAISFYPGLAYQYHLKGENLQLIARGACVPLLGIETHRDGLPDICADIMSEIYEYATAQKSIKTVLISFRGPWYLYGGGASYTKKDLNPILLNGLSFEQAMIKTYDVLMSSNKNMALFLDNPELTFQPQECLDTRPIRIKMGGVRENCFIPESIAKSISQIYREKISEVEKGLPKLKIFDTFKYLCEADKCFAIKDNKLLYDDDNHLSIQGSLVLAEKFMRLDYKLPAKN
jgi:peptidoglycan/LPS O-acetylase OafA/YrhL